MEIVSTPFDLFEGAPEKKIEAKSPSTPTRFWITKGIGESDTSELNAFDAALVDGGIGHLNLIIYSSIIPGNAVPLQLPVEVPPGSRTGTILAKEKGRRNELISSGIAIAKIERPTEHYIVFESHGNSSAKQLEKVLMHSIQEAGEVRGETVSRAYIQTVERKVSKQYGCAIVAIVFDPTTYD